MDIVRQGAEEFVALLPHPGTTGNSKGQRRMWWNGECAASSAEQCLSEFDCLRDAGGSDGVNFSELLEDFN
ncbi:unnamed protein product [Heligmosomoides polygyrus]|uniref:Uncharacterized protein n=1 Tax=Heligmosomoides polygyrus TaxID=6339 RepID=A0A183GQ50_HELPZ|nr:unnamed protein product [Heligmosomoides polygyrus]